jgi:hypothetical protein
MDQNLSKKNWRLLNLRLKKYQKIGHVGNILKKEENIFLRI